ncbi:MAG: protease modulator HflK [Verrucomicrobiota bacterium]
MHEHPHPKEEPREASRPVDSGSQALAEALQSSFSILKFVMLILVAAFFGSGFFTVDQNERAIILRFGKPVGSGRDALLNPGLHWSFPYPIDEYVKVSITGIQQQTSTVGWYATRPEWEQAGIEPPVAPNQALDPEVDGYVLSGDTNILHARATLRYRIDDPVQFEFGFVNATNAIRNALDSALVSSAARFNIDDLLTRDIAGFRDMVRRRVTQLLEVQQVGVLVEDCVVDRVAPRQLKDAFESVIRAGVARNQALNEAHTYENQVLTRASADAVSIRDAAESARIRLVTGTAGEAERFADILPKYRANPELFVQQRLSETLARVLTNVQDKIFLANRADGKTRELRLLLNREPAVPKPPE